MPTAMIALMGDDLSQLQTLADDIVVPALERIDGVAQVTVNGGVEQQIAVELDPTRSAGYGLSTSYVSQFLAGQNLLYPGGDLQNGSQKLTVSTDAKFQTLQDVQDMILTLPTGGAVRLSEVANVTLENKDMSTMAQANGTACVVLQVSKQSSANEVYVSEEVIKRLDSLKPENPSLQYAAPYLASDYINQTVDAVFQNILQGVLLAAVVVLLFLRRVTEAFNALYLKILGFFIRRLFLGMLASFALVVGFGLTLVNTKTVLMPDMDQGQVTVNVSMPIGAQLEKTAAKADQISGIVERTVPEIVDMFYIAQSASVTMMMDVGSKSQRERSSNDIAAVLRTALADVAGCEITISASNSDSMMGSGSDMGITMISGMVISTVITLVFTPVYYSVIDNFSRLFHRRKKNGGKPEAPQPAEAEAQPV